MEIAVTAGQQRPTSTCGRGRPFRPFNSWAVQCGYLLQDFIPIFSGNLFPLGGSWSLLISLGSLALSLGTTKAMEMPSNVP